MKKSIYFFCCCFLLSLFGNLKAQDSFIKNSPAGIVSFGMRSTISTFNNDDWANVGLGAGGGFKVQVAKNLNTDWFFDYIHSDIGQKANRTDYHVGWSVMFYPVPGNEDYTKTLKPFILAGHCFDYTLVSENANPSNNAKRFSSAIQGGLGTHILFSPRFDLTVQAQYMLHLGNDIHADIIGEIVNIEKVKSSSAEGHLLFTIGLNYKLIDLW